MKKELKKYKIIVDKPFKGDDTIFINLYDNTLNKWFGEWITQDFEINGKWASDFEEVELNGDELIDWGLSNE